MSRPRPSLVPLFILGTFITLAGGAALWGAGSLAADGAASEHWTETKGRVVASGVETRRDVGATDGPAAPRRYEHRPAVRYTYTAGGATYTADRVRFGENTAERGEGARARAQAEADRYPEGQDVSVFYDPDDPSRAVLEPGRQSTPWILIVGLLASGMGVALLWSGLRVRRARREADGRG